jgi:hypothetical protein
MQNGHVESFNGGFETSVQTPVGSAPWRMPGRKSVLGERNITASDHRAAWCVRYSGLAHFDTLIWPT